MFTSAWKKMPPRTVSGASSVIRTDGVTAAEVVER